MIISILGQAITQFGELWQSSLLSLVKEAVEKSLLNADLKSENVEAVYVANMSAGAIQNQLHLGALVSGVLGNHQPAMRIEGACASGSLAMLAAEQALRSGLYKTVMVVGVEKMTDVDVTLSTKYLAAAGSFQQEYGSTFPGLYALLAQAHMKKYGTTRTQLSLVTVKNHLHAFDNPDAQFHKKITTEQVDKSQFVAEPLRLLDCSPITDGAAAVILTSKKIKNKVQIAGVGHGQDTLDLAHRETLTSLTATVRAADLAYSEANLQPSSIQVAEVHDCFTIAEILAYEDLGLVKPGQGGSAVEAGKMTYGGKVVINPSGGLKACGHPVGATGVKQIAYLSKLLSQDRFQVGLTHNVGGSGATSIVHILTK